MQGGGPKRIRNGYVEARQRRRRAFSRPPEATLFWADLGVAPPRRIDFDTPRRRSLMPAQNSVVAGSLGFEMVSHRRLHNRLSLANYFFGLRPVWGFSNNAHDRLGVAGAGMEPGVGEIDADTVLGVDFLG